MNEKLFVLETQKKKTSHILHLILSIITGGLWLIVWLIVASNNSSHNAKLSKEMNAIAHYKTQGLSDVETHRAIVEEKAATAASTRKAVLVCVAIVIGVVILNKMGS